MSKAPFGERLKRERELRGVSREEISAATRIGIRYLEALENEQWEILPGGIFNRGFVRAVARFVGLDEDDLLAEYDFAIREQISGVEPGLSPPVPRNAVKTQLRRSLLLGTVCAVVLLGAGLIAWRWQHERARQATHERKDIVSAVAETGLPDAIARSASAENLAGTAVSPPLVASVTPSRTEKQDLQLKIEAGKQTALSVSADGSKVFEGSMIAGQSRTFAAQDAIDVSAKDAGALLLELNGQTLAPLGPPGQPGNVTLTRSDLKPTGGGTD